MRGVIAGGVLLALTLATWAADAEVDVKRNVLYCAADDPDRQALDLYRPMGVKNYPLLVFFHGGGYTKGSRADVAPFAQVLAKQGIGVAAVGYRLSPTVQPPGQTHEAATALAWLKKNIAEHDGNPDAVFVGGHSAGAHLVTLLACDEQYLKGQKLTFAAIKGVVSLSGIYELPENRAPVFGDAAARAKASPQRFVAAGLPPFWLGYADGDTPERAPQTKEFAAALAKVQVPVETFVANERDHSSIFTKITASDHTGMAIVKFIRQHAGP
jgi:acetyl esterase/lipase